MTVPLPIADQLLTAHGAAFEAALAAATHVDLEAARWEIDQCGPAQYWRQDALMIARGRVLAASLAAALRTDTAAAVPLEAFDGACAQFEEDVRLGMWRWDPAWGFERVPDPWPLAYLFEAARW